FAIDYSMNSHVAALVNVTNGTRPINVASQVTASFLFPLKEVEPTTTVPEINLSPTIPAVPSWVVISISSSVPSTKLSRMSKKPFVVASTSNLAFTETFHVLVPAKVSPQLPEDLQETSISSPSTDSVKPYSHSITDSPMRTLID